MSGVNDYSQLPIPKYYQIFISLRELIENGDYPEGQSIPSERELTKKFNVSRITIVKAIDLLVQEGRIERKQGVGNFVIPTLKEVERSYLTIAFVIIHELDDFPASVLRGVLKDAMKEFVQVQVVSHLDEKKCKQLYEEYESGIIQGLIIIPFPDIGRSWIKRLHDINAPYVLADRYYPDIASDSVVFNDEEIAYQLTTQVIQAGFKRIAFVPHSEILSTSVINRLKGFQRALLEADYQIDEDLIWLHLYRYLDQEGQLKYDNSTVILKQYIENYHPDAVFAVNHRVMEKIYFDLMTLQNEEMLSKISSGYNQTKGTSKYAVGQVGICDHVLNFLNPTYQCVAFQGGEDLGYEAMKILIGQLRNKENQHERMTRVHKIIPMEIMNYSQQLAETENVKNSLPDDLAKG